MSDRTTHYREAEALLAEGVEAVTRIEEAAALRQRLLEDHLGPDGFSVENDEVAAQIRAITAGMDAYGRKAMGIWAQAQVHATLATVDPGVARPPVTADLP